MSNRIEPYTFRGIVEDRTTALHIAHHIRVYYDPDFNVWFGEHDTIFNGIDGETCNPDEPFQPIYLLIDELVPIKPEEKDNWN